MLLFSFACLCIACFAFESLQDNAIYRSEPHFSVDLAQLELKEHRKGGSGGVYIATAHNSTFTIKFSSDTSHFQEEVLADKLYDALGIRTPRFVVVNNYTLLSADIQNIVQSLPFVRIAEYIEHATNLPSNISSETSLHFQNTFMVDAFMANRDANKVGNHIYSESGVFYRIDNGGSLRNRSASKRKKGSKRSDQWDAQLMPELKSMVRFNTALYSDISEEMMARQARAIVNKSIKIMKLFQEVSSAIAMDEITVNVVREMLLARLHLLEMLLHPGTSYPASVDRPVSMLSAAGVFLVCTRDREQYVLLGKRRSTTSSASNNHWVSFGGKVEFGQDISFEATAVREFYEETSGLMTHVTVVKEDPFHDIVHEDHIFRQYFVHTDSCIDESLLITATPPAELAHSHSLGPMEYQEFKWFPIHQLRNTTLVDTVIGTTGELAYYSFAQLIQIPRVQSILLSLEKNASFPAPLHAQSMSKRSDYIPSEYGTFTI